MLFVLLLYLFLLNLIKGGVILITCFLCFSVSAIICKNSDYTDTCTSIFLFLGWIFSLFCFVCALLEGIE